jgi:GntR family transcriptional regulator
MPYPTPKSLATANVQNSALIDMSELSRLLARFARDGVPKYLALRDAVIHALASGSVQAGNRMPTEQELAAHLPLSLGTIQRGLRQLVEERILVRKPGQGSFIAGQQREQLSAPFHCRFLDDSGQAYLPVFPKITLRERVHAQSSTLTDWKTHLRTDSAVRIDRLIRIADEFTVLSEFYVDPLRLPVFEASTLKNLSTQNFKEIIFRHCGESIGRVDTFMRVVNAGTASGKLLGISARSSCTEIHAHAYLRKREAIYYQRLIIPPTSRQLHIVADSSEPGFED